MTQEKLTAGAPGGKNYSFEEFSYYIIIRKYEGGAGHHQQQGGEQRLGRVTAAQRVT